MQMETAVYLHIFFTVALIAVTSLSTYFFTRVAYDKTLNKKEREHYLVLHMKFLIAVFFIAQTVGLGIFLEKGHLTEFNKRFNGQLWISSAEEAGTYPHEVHK
jgi:hypothetical protein